MKFVAGGKLSGSPVLNADGTVTRGGRVLKVERDGLPANAEIELAVQHAGEVRGRFLLTAAARIARPDLEQRPHLDRQPIELCNRLPIGRFRLGNR